MSDNEELELEYVFSKKITNKLKNKHSVTQKEVKECFERSSDTVIEETKEGNITTPPSWWFLAETKAGRELKVVFVFVEPNQLFIKTSFEPNQKDRDIFYDQENK